MRFFLILVFLFQSNAGFGSEQKKEDQHAPEVKKTDAEPSKEEHVAPKASSHSSDHSSEKTSKTSEHPKTPVKKQATKKDSAGSHEKHWGYQGETGPKNWASLKEEFKVCGEGQNQSPVDLHKFVSGKPEPIQFMYRPTSAEVVNNGHTVQVNMGPGSSIRVGGTRYDLIQFHFHTPSEHAFHGRLAELEVHFVHKSSEGKLAVVGVMIEKGNANEWLESIWKNIPKDINQPLPLTDLLLNPFVFLPEDKDYYSYAGSLTTPPCSEGVAWNVLKKSITFSQEQIKLFRSFYERNARPVQPLLGRKVVSH